MKIGWHLACTAATFALLGGCGGPASDETAQDSVEPVAPELAEAAEEATEAKPDAPAPPAVPDISKAAEATGPVAPATPPVAFMQCRSCHSIEPGKNGIGPSLHGVVGKKAASAPGFNYSPALKGAGITWDRASLDKWLSGPAQMVPGTRMILGVRNEEQRAAVIDYLETLK